MNLRLKRLERHPLAIDADVPRLLLARHDAVPQYLAVADKRLVEEFVALDGEHEVDGGCARDAAVDADQVHEAVAGECGREEVCVGGHVGHLRVLTNISRYNMGL